MKPKSTLLFFIVGLSFFWMSCGTSKKSTAPVNSGSANVPVKRDSLVVAKDTTPITIPSIHKLTIALVLPLQIDAHFKNDTNPDGSPLILPEALQALNFLEGAKLAQADLKNDLVNLEFKIIDTGSDSLSTVKTLQTASLKGVDAVISLLSPNFNNASATCSDRLKKPFYFFYGSNTQILENHPWLRLASPSNNTQIRQTAIFMAEKYPASNFIIVSREQRRENDIAALFASVIDSIRGKSNGTVINYKSDGWSLLKSKLLKNKRNLIIIPTSDESFLSSILNKISEVKTDYSFMLCGMPGWETFNSIDPQLMKELEAVFFNGMYADISSPSVNAFRKKFISEYHADPLIQAYMAYDQISFIASQEFRSGGKKLVYSNLLYHSNGPEQLLPVCDACGFERKSVNIIKFDDYKFVLLK